MGSPTGEGWRLLEYSEALDIKNYLNDLLDVWSIVAFRTGKIDGSGYGNEIHETYGG